MRKKGLHESILEILTCPVCDTKITPPIARCVNEHIFCNACKKRVRVCPVCRGDISQTRNRQLDEIAKLLTYPCTNQDMGCDEKLNYANKKTHEEHCQFVMIKCPAVTNWHAAYFTMSSQLCNWKWTGGPEDELDRHMGECNNDVCSHRGILGDIEKHLLDSHGLQFQRIPEEGNIIINVPHCPWISFFKYKGHIIRMVIKKYSREEKEEETEESKQEADPWPHISVLIYTHFVGTEPEDEVHYRLSRTDGKGPIGRYANLRNYRRKVASSEPINEQASSLLEKRKESIYSGTPDLFERRGLIHNNGRMEFKMNIGD